MKSFLVIGLGRFGRAVACELGSLGHEVLALDNSEENVQHIADSVTQAVCGDAQDESVLTSLGVRNFDCCVVAIGTDIEASILVTVMLKELGAKQVVCKALSALHARVLERVGADRVIQPEKEIGQRLAQHLGRTNVIDYIHSTASSHSRVFVVELMGRDAGWLTLNAGIASGADMTAVCTSLPGPESDTYFQLDNSGRIVDVAHDVFTPEGFRCLNIFVLRRDLLIQLVTDCMAHNQYSFRHNILQDRKDTLHFRAYVWDGYAARIDTIEAYYRRSMELLRPEIRMELFAPQRPIFAKENDSPSSYMDGSCVNSLIADGCDIQGTVKNCILFRGVRIEPGADVEGCILFKGTVVRRGAVLRGVITDKYVTVQEGRTLMGHENYPLVVARGVTI